MTWPLIRGQVIRADIGLAEPKLFVVVSNNRRNKNLGQVLAVRLTTTPKPPIPSIVPLSHDDGLTGSVVCDDIVEIYEDEVQHVVSALTPASIRAVNEGLRAALDLP